MLESPCREEETLVFCVRLLRLNFPLLDCVQLLYPCVSGLTDSLVYVATSEFFAASKFDWVPSLNFSVT